MCDGQINCAGSEELSAVCWSYCAEATTKKSAHVTKPRGGGLDGPILDGRDSGWIQRSEDKADGLNGLGNRFTLRVSELTGIVALCGCTSDLTGLSPSVFAIDWDCSAREACASGFAVVA